MSASKKDKLDIDNIDPDLIKLVKDQILAELKSEDDKKAALRKKQHNENLKAHTVYTNKMKKSSEPWVDITSWSEGVEGAEIKLDWNDAFIAELKAKGYTGANEEAMVQQYVGMLSHSIATSEEDIPKGGDFE